ncbi:MAG: Dihydrofolate reductase, partial [uncultured Nocardioidaceae bacterium]
DLLGDPRGVPAADAGDGARARGAAAATRQWDELHGGALGLRGRRARGVRRVGRGRGGAGGRRGARHRGRPEGRHAAVLRAAHPARLRRPRRAAGRLLPHREALVRRPLPSRTREVRGARLVPAVLAAGADGSPRGPDPGTTGGRDRPADPEHRLL